MGVTLKHRAVVCRTTLLAAAVAVVLSIAATRDSSAQSVWTGGAGVWHDNQKWTQGIPNNAIDAVLGSDAAVVLTQNAAVRGLTINSANSLTIPHGFLLDLYGNATIDGALNLQSTGVNATTVLRAQNDLTLGGAGVVTLSNQTNNQIISFSDSVSGPRRITIGSVNGSAFGLEGAGNLGANLATFTNLATIEANQSTPLIIKPAFQLADEFINQGTLRAANGAMLQLTESTYTNAGGLIQAQNGSVVDLAHAVHVLGGVLSTTGTGQLIASGVVTLENVTLTQNSQLNIQSTKRIDLKGEFNNNGLVRPTAGGGVTDLRILGDTTISGTGSIVLSDPLHRIYAEAASQRLTIGPQQTIRGAGNIGADQAKITNLGNIIADSAAPLIIDVSNNLDDAFTNKGLIRVEAIATLKVQEGARLIQNDTEASTLVLGTMNVLVFELQAGRLGGTGTIVGNVRNTRGTLSPGAGPGASPGKTTISGNYTQGANATFLAEINGTEQGISYDWLDVTGSATLGGTLDLRFGFTPTPGTSFILITTGSGSVSGQFDNILIPAGWDVTPIYDGKDLTLSITAVPESETYLLMLTGVGLIAWAVKRRQRKARTNWPI